ncbi:hypothetical protein EJB05_10423, partial [Eragrostis curvula]
MDRSLNLRVIGGRKLLARKGHWASTPFSLGTGTVCGAFVLLGRLRCLLVQHWNIADMRLITVLGKQRGTARHRDGVRRSVTGRMVKLQKGQDHCPSTVGGVSPK